MSNKLTACFNGCSFTYGEGFPAEQRDLYVFDRLISNSLQFNHINIAEPGSSNHRIFIRSIHALEKKICNFLFVQWSALNRLVLSPGPEIWYNTIPNPKIKEFRHKDIVLKNNQKLNFELTIRLLNHDYNNILELIDYCNILSKLAKISGTTLIFVNGLVPWTDDLVRPLTNDLHSCLSEYTRQILDFDNRDDDEIVYFVSQLQKKFSTMDQTQWVNLFDSWTSNIIDVGPEGHHPGVKSNQWMADKIIQHIEKIL
jgi:hypothetical protein